AVAFAFGCLASLGLPGLAGFWGEMLVLRGAYEVGPVLSKTGAWILLGVAALGIVLTTAYFVGVIRRLLQGEPGASPEPIGQLRSDDRQRGDQGAEADRPVAPLHVTDRRGSAEAEAEPLSDEPVDLDPEQATATGVLVFAIVALGLVPGLLS